MRTKNILKKDAAAFCKDAAALITRLGFQPFPADVPGYDYHSRDQRIQTDAGIYIVHLPSMETWYPSTLEDLNGYFQEPARAARKVDCNPYSGKWNLLHSDPAYILRAFESRMNRIGARALLPGKMEEADAADAAKLAKYRADMAEFMAADREGVAVS
jgi:hypothetical protein